MKTKTLKLLGLVFTILLGNKVWATGEPSTYFNIFVPPNAEAIQRNVCLVVTAIYDSTSFTILDDDMDGDNDDTKSGILMAGQSYVLYIKDNGINDDAKYASGGILKQDGDYFIVTANKLVYTSQSTDSDWQHDWVPAINKTSKGQKFIVYAPKISSSNRDLNVFVYEDQTKVTIRKISTQAKTNTGFTDVNMYNGTVVAQVTLNIGEDIIYKNTNGRDVMLSGHTYLVEANKPITVQYGSLYVNERDGGGYVPSSNGSCSGSLFYFGVPYQAAGEQEIRVSSWDDANTVQLERYSNGSWVAMQSWNLNRFGAAEWVGKSNGNVSYPTVFRVTCTNGKRVGVFEANWLETGNPGTSDIGTMVSAENGTTAGKDFLVYMAPPGNEYNVINPFTGLKFNQQLTHLFITSKKGATVSVKDARTNGGEINRQYTIAPGRYADCFLTLNEWKSIYNGTGTAAGGPERPYLLVSADEPVAVMNTNFNDNWMLYTGSSLPQSFKQSSFSSINAGIPGQNTVVTSDLVFLEALSIQDPTVQVNVGSGLTVVDVILINTSSGDTINGTTLYSDNGSTVTFDNVSTLDPNSNYQVITTVKLEPMYNNGVPIPANTVIGIETIVSGTVDGAYQQSVTTNGVSNNTADFSNQIFTLVSNAGTITTELTDTWSANWIDYDNDGWEDLFITEYQGSKANYLYRNNGNGSFTKTSINGITTDKARSIGSSWVDMDNDGDLDLLVANNGSNLLYKNNGGTFEKVTSGDIINNNGYDHAVAWADYDNDGLLDAFLCSYMPTRFNRLYRNEGEVHFSKVSMFDFPSEATMSTGAAWADYDNDGFQDLFVPCGNSQGGVTGAKNMLYHNNGNGTFTRITNGDIVNEVNNSTGCTWGDYNNDGFLDLFVANASNQNNCLYKNLGNGSFQKITQGAIVNDGGHSHACNWIDVNNDGFLDLYVSNDKNRKFLYINNGNETFTKNTSEYVTSSFGNTITHAFADYNKDGFMDLFTGTHGTNPNFLFRNNGNSNHWLGLKLQGTISNRDAIGARIKVKSGGTWQYREVNSQTGFGGQNSLRQQIGLGSNTLIDTMIIRWPSGHEQVLSNIGADQSLTIVEPNKSLIKGRLFWDANQNCQFDANEVLVPQAKLSSSSGQITSTRSDGTFKLYEEIGQYTIQLVDQSLWNSSCHPQGVTVNISQIGDTVTQDIPVLPIVVQPDVVVDANNVALRRGFKGEININCMNIGSQSTSSGQLKLTLPSGITPSEFSKSFDQHPNDSTYVWNVNGMQTGEKFNVTFKAQVGLVYQVGDVISYSLAYESNDSDINGGNNTMLMSATIVGAIDPNELLVSPKGYGDLGFVDKNQALTYRVNFQNIGSYYAENVYVTDVLPSELDPSTLQMVGSSHSISSFSLKGSVLHVSFEGINLPDSTTGKEASNGYLLFKISPVKNISAGVTIRNKASIAFDFEDPILTNTTVNTTKLPEAGLAAAVYPIPTAEYLDITLLNTTKVHEKVETISEMRITDASGHLKQAFVISHDTDDTYRLNVGRFENGYYLLEIITDRGNRVVQRFMVAN